MRTEAQHLRKTFFRLALLNVLASLTVPLVGLVDAALLGHQAQVRDLAGVGLASLLFDYVYWSFGFLRMSTTGLAAQAEGQALRQEVFDVLYRALAIALLGGTVIFAVRGPFAELGFWLLSGNAEVEQAGRQYFASRILGAPAALAHFALVGWFLGRGSSGKVLAITVVGNLANVGVSYFLIVERGLGAAGAGLGSAISQYCALALGLILLTSERPFPLPDWRRTFSWGKLRLLLALNLNILIRTVCLVTAFAIFTNTSALLGTTVLAANTLLLRVLALGSYIIDGLAYAMETLAGLFLGRKDGALLARARRLALASSFGAATAIVLPCVVAPQWSLGWLTSHQEVNGLVVTSSIWLVPTLLVGSFAYIYDGYFLGLSEGKILRNAMLVSFLVVFVPLIAVASKSSNPSGLWLALSAFMVARVATLWPFATSIEQRLRSES